MIIWEILQTILIVSSVMWLTDEINQLRRSTKDSQLEAALERSVLRSRQERHDTRIEALEYDHATSGKMKGWKDEQGQ